MLIMVRGANASHFASDKVNDDDNEYVLVIYFPGRLDSLFMFVAVCCLS